MVVLQALKILAFYLKQVFCVSCSHNKEVKLSVICGWVCGDMAQREKVSAADLTTLLQPLLIMLVCVYGLGYSTLR